jgi:hypothetical protein
MATTQVTTTPLMLKQGVLIDLIIHIRSDRPYQLVLRPGDSMTNDQDQPRTMNEGNRREPSEGVKGRLEHVVTVGIRRRCCAASCARCQQVTTSPFHLGRRPPPSPPSSPSLPHVATVLHYPVRALASRIARLLYPLLGCPRYPTSSPRSTAMKFTLAASALALLAGSAAGQQAPIAYDQEHNFTSLAGTWASGSQQVLTGAVSSPCVVATSSRVLIGMRAR